MDLVVGKQYIPVRSDCVASVCFPSPRNDSHAPRQDSHTESPGYRAERIEGFIILENRLFPFSGCIGHVPEFGQDHESCPIFSRPCGFGKERFDIRLGAFP